MKDIAVFPDKLLVEDFSKSLADSGRAHYIGDIDVAIADHLRTAGQPELIVCDFTRLVELKKLAEESQEFAYLRQTRLVIIFSNKDMADHFMKSAKKNLSILGQIVEAVGADSQSAGDISAMALSYVPPKLTREKRDEALDRSRSAPCGVPCWPK